MLLIALVAAVFVFQVTAAEEEKANEKEKEKVQVQSWYLLGPFDAPFPAFNDEGEDKMKAGDLLKYEHVALRKLRPVEGAGLNLVDGKTAKWKKVLADTMGAEIPADTTFPLVAYLAAYVEVPRWMKIDVEARSTNQFEVFVDESSVIKNTETGSMSDDKNKKSGSAKLEMGKHLLLVKAVYVPADTVSSWRVDVKLGPGKDFEEVPVVSLDPERTMNITDVLDVPSIGGVDVSPDGTYFMVSISEHRPPEGDTEERTEVRRFKDGGLVKTFKDMSSVSSREWAPTGNRISYVVREKDKSTFRILDLETDRVETVLEGIKDFSGYTWSPDGSFIVYSVNVEPEEDKTGVKRHRGIYDRRGYERNKSNLYVASVPSGVTRKLTAGEYSTFLYDIHPDGKTMLIGRGYEDLTERPYGVTELISLDLENQKTELVLTGRWLGGAQWSPDGKKLLVTGGVTTFGDAGKNVAEGIIPNDYDTQAYLFDPVTKEATPITKDFNPTVTSVYWPEPGDYIYLIAEEGEYVKPYKYDVGKKTFKNIPLECDVIRRGDVARDKPVAVVAGSGAGFPARLYTVDLKSGKVRKILDPAGQDFEHVKIGKIEDFDFDSASGKKIVGRIHYPPDFDPNKKYPCIVYYYGGTSPVDRSFGGRYPKNLWAAAGYVIYVLQPSGATGFGQEFSARHVNDWGKTTVGEIIEGTTKFLAAHPFVDPERTGCIGASYGGFMTQLLITKTDMFAAAVSHAGISDITSYWGEGYWGYLYNAVSAANSFPWNRPDIYIEQSPLFAADKVNTPLLLLHGAADTNVPPGESEQMYTALKLLGKEVEYIKVADQNHWIVDYKKRIVWSNAILSWFDKWLKDQPQWWEDMYPPLDKKETGEEDEKK